MTIEDAGEAGREAADKAASSSQDDRDWEAEARKLGWVPEEEFKGDRKPARFKSAKEFVEDGETLTPHMKRLLAAKDKETDERIARLERMNEKTVAKLQQQHEAEIKALTAERKQAIKDGDAEKVAELSDEIAEKKASAPDAGDAPDADDVDEMFRKRNDWYGEDEELTAMAIRESEALVKAYALKHKAQMPLKEMIEKVEKKVKASAEYKAKFPDGSTGANGHAPVDGGGEGAGPSKGDPFSKLSNAERAKATEDMKKFPKIYPTKQSWLDAYNS